MYESEHAKRNIPTDLGKTKGQDVVTNALHSLDHFSEGADYEHFNWGDYELEKEPHKFNDGFYNLQDPALGSIRPTLKDLKQEFARPPFQASTPIIKGTFKPSLITGKPKGNVKTTTLKPKKPIKVVKKKKKTTLKLPKLPKLNLPKIVTTTVAPSTNLLSTLMPKIPNLGAVASGFHQEFIDKPIGRVRDFVTGIFGPKNSKEKEISERTMFVNDNSDFEENFKEDFSEGGKQELTKLERIKMLLRDARDKPLL